MNYNNSTKRTTLIVLILFAFLSLEVLPKLSHASVKPIEEMEEFNFQNQDGKWIMKLQVAHHKMQLKVKMAAERSWIKEALCVVCQGEAEECKKNTTCFSSHKDPKISCDSAYCSKNGEYESQKLVLRGIDAEFFCKIDKSEKALIPLILAKRIAEPIGEMGEFNLMDSSSSFNHGLVYVEGQRVRVINLNVRKEEKVVMQRNAFDSVSIPMNEESLGFRKGNAIQIRNQIQQYKTITIDEPKGYTFELSMSQIGITVPGRLLHELQRQIMSQYFQQNSCRFDTGKIKCRQQVDFEGLTTAIFEFNFEGGYTLSMPFHLLLGSCSSRECKLLLSSHNKMSQITVGTIIWETIGLEWNIEEKSMEIYRLNNNWASVYTDQIKHIKKQSFLANLFLVIYHILKYIVLTLLGLAVFSLFVNCIFKWKDVLRYIRRILVKLRGRGVELDQADDEDFNVDHRAGRSRRIQRLPDDIEDEL